MTPSTSSTPNARPRRRGIGWLLIVALFACMGLLPFAIAAIVLLGR